MSDHARLFRHLSMLEEGAYLRLASAYFSKMQPLPSSLDANYRLAMARSKDERAAVDCVLQECFQATPEGWRSEAFDKQIQAYNESIENASKAANIRWGSKRASEQERADSDRNTGGMRAHSGGTANHDPVSISHETKTPQSQPKAECDQSQPPAERRGKVSKAEPRPVDGYPMQFRRFWNAAPRRKNIDLPATFEAYQDAVERLKGVEADPDAFLLKHIRRFAKEYAGTETIYVTCAKNWLKQSRWTDEYSSDPAPE